MPRHELRVWGKGYLSASAMPSGSGSRGARIHTSCAVVSAPTLDRALARWCLTFECLSGCLRQRKM